MTSSPSPMDSPTVYQDKIWDRLFIALFSRKMANAIGCRPTPGYAGFVALSKQIMRGRTPKEQQAVVGIVLRSLVPAPVLWGIRTLFSPTRWVCESNAWFAANLFEWLVGPCEVQTADIPQADGTVQTQASKVQIKKCRYLEESACVGLCVNLCKVPTQEFFTNEFGIPVTMNPNFDDLSCEMIFGQHATPVEDDDNIQQQPCFVDDCAIASPKAPSCPKVG
ncbi:MAG: DUF4033 domain-containing protein [Leptolyngbyaceae cyanobacterium]